MARFKSEFLADYCTPHGTPPRAQALGNVHRIAVLGSLFAPIANWVTARAPVSWMNEQLFGIDIEATLPVYSARYISQWARNIVRFGGTKRSRYLTTHSPTTTIRRLESRHWKFWSTAGAGERCTARLLRTSFDLAGLLSDARRNAAAAVEALFPVARAEKRSCSASPVACRRRKTTGSGCCAESWAKARAVAAACRMFDEFAAELDLPPLRAASGRLLLHGHCHQKSLGLLSATVALLSRIPSAKVGIWTRGVAAWPGRSVIHAGTTMCRWRLPSSVCCPRCGRWNRAISRRNRDACRHQVAELQGTKGIIRDPDPGPLILKNAD